MGNLLSNPATDAGLLDAKDDSGPRSPVSPYNGAQSSGTESAQDETEPTMRRPTTSYMPHVLTTPTNVSSPILPAAPSAYPTTLESTLDVVTEQPTSQMNTSDVTPNLFSPTTPEPTVIPCLLYTSDAADE